MGGWGVDVVAAGGEGQCSDASSVSSHKSRRDDLLSEGMKACTRTTVPGTHFFSLYVGVP